MTAGDRTPRWASIKRLVYRTGVACAGPALGRALNRSNAVVVMYHGLYEGHVDPLLNLDGLHVDVAEFRRQVEYLARHYAVVPLGDLFTGGEKPKAAITFDDGYGSVGRHAAPILSAMGVPSTVFVTTDFVLRRRPMWWDRARLLIRGCRARTVRVKVKGVPLVLGTQTPGEKAEAIGKLQEPLMWMTADTRNAVLADLAAAADGHDAGADSALFEPLAEAELAALERAGMSVEGHAVSHDSLMMMAKSRLEGEVTASKQLLEARLGKTVEWFSYPYGHVDARVAEAVRRAGYRGAVTAAHGLNGAAQDRFWLRRIAVGGHTNFDQFRMLTSDPRAAIRRR